MRKQSHHRKPSSAKTDLLEVLLAGTSGETGLPFFRALVSGICEALKVHGAWVAEYEKETESLRAIACRFGDAWVEEYHYTIAGTPCGECIRKREMLVVADQLADLFPQDSDLGALGAASYIGMAFFDETGRRLLGHLAVLDTQPIGNPERYSRVFRIFANRAGAELRRCNLERELRARSEELDAVLQSAMDAVLILDDNHDIVRANPAAESALATDRIVGELVDRFLSVQGAKKLEPILNRLLSQPVGTGGQMWIPAEVEARSAKGLNFVIEGTLSRFDLHGRPYASMIFRNVSDRLAAEARLHDLARQSDYLRAEIEHPFGEIIGDSPATRHLVAEISRVASTDVSVLISGETGTGKELVAHAIHRRSRRATQPLIKVNCAAIPEQLIESEFFGHEKGAFSGAVARRDGRFSLADGGTLFLDEVGELPLALQAKLLRVLQEGEFERVGTSHTIRVDVRIIAATNRDLQKESAAGRFREDLFYRLCVFPIIAPPLRDRTSDIAPLAREFVRRFCTRNARSPIQITDLDLDRLRSYDWPGNVRELANVIERALITGEGQHLNLDRALPETKQPPESRLSREAVTDADGDRVLKIREIEILQRENILRALRHAHGKVSGAGGAADLLGLKPTTLRSRLNALGIRANDEMSS